MITVWTPDGKATVKITLPIQPGRLVDIETDTLLKLKKALYLK